MSRFTDAERQTLSERDHYLEHNGRTGRLLSVRPAIAASWQRSLEKQVNPNRSLPDFQRPGETQLSAAALPVIDHHLESLIDTGTSLLFADAAGRLIGRWTHDARLRHALSSSYVEAGFSMSEAIVGTNGVGTVFEAGRAVEIRGPEHFSDHYLSFACVGAPIRHPLTRRIVGVIDVTCRLEEATALAMPWILNVAHQIEQQLLDRATVHERELLSAYLVAARRSDVAVACLDGQMLIGNSAASALLRGSDQSQIWSYMQRRDFRMEPTFVPFGLTDGRVLMLRARAVRHDGVVIGIVAEAYEPAAIEPGQRSTAPAPAHLPGLVGASDRWVNLCADALTAKQRGGGIVVTGEPGVGKFAVLTALFADAEPVTVLDCAMVVVDGPRAWLSSLRERLSDDGGVVVLRHLDSLDPTIAQAVCSLLDATQTPPRLAATVTTGGTSIAFAPLVDRFEAHRIEVPPLRLRLDDLTVLLEHLVQHSRPATWLPETVRVLSNARWPDNVRGLGALARRAARGAAGSAVAVTDLPPELATQRADRRALTQLEQLERQEIIEALVATGGNKLLAARRLNLARSTLYRKIASFNIPSKLPGSRPHRGE